MKHGPYNIKLNTYVFKRPKLVPAAQLSWNCFSKWLLEIPSQHSERRHLTQWGFSTAVMMKIQVLWDVTPTSGPLDPDGWGQNAPPKYR